MSDFGRVELLSSEHVAGWAAVQAGQPAVVYARLDGQVIGVATANLKRKDLAKAAAEARLLAFGFLIVFRHGVSHDRLNDIEVLPVNASAPLKKGAGMRFDRTPKLQVFVLGSPRSGTSELGNTIAKQLNLRWLGEGHAAPLFASAAKQLAGNRESPNGLVRYMAEQDVREQVLEAAKRAYFFRHGSASFVDKTPGIEMIKSAPFLLECFPEAKFVYLRRNGISNVLSRMAKFGGSFDKHCADWAAALEEWLKIRDQLPHFLEVEQEKMAEEPGHVSRELAEYLGVPEANNSIRDSLVSGALEATGAGRGKKTLGETGWTRAQIEQFKRLCGSTMEKFGYSVA